MKASIVLLLAVMSLMSACSSRETQLDPIADQLSAAVNRCVIDVRDKGDKYETSENCRSLGEIAKQYIGRRSKGERAMPCGSARRKRQGKSLDGGSRFQIGRPKPDRLVGHALGR